MNNKRLNILLGVVALICALVTIFTLFANAFADVRDLGDAHGSVYSIMFDYKAHGYNAVPALVVAFSFSIVGAVFALGTAFLPGKINSIVSAISGALMAAAGIIFFCGNAIFVSANPEWAATIAQMGGLSLGVGLIVPGIFALLHALLSFYAAYKNFKA